MWFGLSQRRIRNKSQCPFLNSHIMTRQFEWSLFIGKEVVLDKSRPPRFITVRYQKPFPFGLDNLPVWAGIITFIPG